MNEALTPDLLIIGGGLAGLALAVALIDSSLEVLVVDPQKPLPPDHWPAEFDPRVSALTHASENILRHLGAWDWIAEQQRVAAFSKMDVWDGDGVGNIQFYAQEVGTSHLGHIVENRVTLYGLWQQLIMASNIHFVQASLSKILEAEAQDKWQVLLSNGQLIEPTLLVGADGARSKVRDQLGFRCRQWSYEQSAIVTTVVTEKTHDNTARQIFLESGPLAFLPLREQSNQSLSATSSIVWSIQNSHLDSIMALSDEAFCHQLGSAFEHRLGAVLQTDKRFSFPLVQNHAVDYITGGAALVGDAAHSIHPLAGQGINMGFLDVAVLAEEILRAQAGGLDIADSSVLRRYQRRRKSHNLAMMGAMEGFKQLFGTTIPPFRIARNFGLSLVNRHGILKNTILSRAMGLEGPMPTLAQPGLLADF